MKQVGHLPMVSPPSVPPDRLHGAAVVTNARISLSFSSPVPTTSFSSGKSLHDDASMTRAGWMEVLSSSTLSPSYSDASRGCQAARCLRRCASGCCRWRRARLSSSVLRLHRFLAVNSVLQLDCLFDSSPLAWRTGHLPFSRRLPCRCRRPSAPNKAPSRLAPCAPLLLPLPHWFLSLLQRCSTKCRRRKKW
jgi:hypothetical protein